MKRRFFIGFFSGLLIFTAINVLATHLASDCGLPAVLGLGFCADDIVRVGWPLQFHEQGGFIYRNSFNPLFLYIDIAMGIAVAVLTGWIFARNKKIPPK